MNAELSVISASRERELFLTVLSTSLGKTLFAWRFISNEKKNGLTDNILSEINCFLFVCFCCCCFVVVVFCCCFCFCFVFFCLLLFFVCLFFVCLFVFCCCFFFFLGGGLLLLFFCLFFGFFFVLFFSVFCFQILNLKLNLRPKIGLTYAISTLK